MSVKSSPLASPKPSPKPSPNHRNIVDRLTDPSLYTGSHVHRFDSDGKGRGIVGRSNVVEFKGMTNTKETSDVRPLERKPVVTKPIGAEKFGTQAAKAIAIRMYRNGDKHHGGEAYTVSKLKSLDQLYDKASALVRLPTGAVRKLYAVGSRAPIKTLEELVDGGSYLCCGGEKIADDDKLPQPFRTQ